MPTLIDNLNLINSYKSDIKSAIENKGVDMTGVSFGGYAEKIGEIQTGGTFVTETLSVTQNNTYYPGQGVDGFSEVIVNVPQTGFTEKDVTEGVYLENVNNSASFVHMYAYAGNSNILTVNLPNASYVDYNAFMSCDKLTSVYLSTCSIINSGVFSNCSSLLYISAPNCISIGVSAFVQCYSLSDVIIPNCIQLDTQAFARCSNISNINFTRCIFVGNAVFSNCIGLQNVSLNNCYIIGGSTFISCRNVENISLKKCINIGANAFNGCAKLSQLSIPLAIQLGGSVIKSCGSLVSLSIPIVVKFENQALADCSIEQLYLGLSTYFVPSYNNALVRTPIGSGNGSIYVGSTIYDSIISANGWSSLGAQIVSVQTPGFTALSFSDGMVYGDTEVIESGYSSYLGISKPGVLIVSLNSCKVVASETFGRCSNIKNVNLPECEILAENAFSECTALSDISLPKCTHILNRAFNGATQFASTDINLVLPVCEYIGDYAFNWAKKIKTLTLQFDGVCTLGGRYALYNTENLESIYVPSSLVDVYKSAQYWSSFSTKIFPIPEP